MGAKHHWSLVNTEEQNRKSPALSKRTQDNQLMLMDHPNAKKGYQNLQLSVTIKHTNINAIIDTGSTFSLVQYKIWKKLNKKGDDQFTTSKQSFILANGQSQKAIGKVRWMCEIKEEKFEVEFFVMEDKDLAVSVILGLDFLQKSKWFWILTHCTFISLMLHKRNAHSLFIHKMDHPTTIFTWLSWIQMSLLSSVK